MFQWLWDIVQLADLVVHLYMISSGMLQESEALTCHISSWWPELMGSWQSLKYGYPKLHTRQRPDAKPSHPIFGDCIPASDKQQMHQAWWFHCSSLSSPGLHTTSTMDTFRICAEILCKLKKQLCKDAGQPARLSSKHGSKPTGIQQRRGVLTAPGLTLQQPVSCFLPQCCSHGKALLPLQRKSLHHHASSLDADIPGHWRLTLSSGEPF